MKMQKKKVRKEKEGKLIEKETKTKEENQLMKNRQKRKMKETDAKDLKVKQTHWNNFQ